MKTIRPWSKESERILDQLVKDGKAWSKNSKLAIEFGKKHPDLIDKGFMSIGWIRKNHERMFVTYPNVKLIPIESRPSRHVNKKYQFFKIF